VRKLYEFIFIQPSIGNLAKTSVVSAKAGIHKPVDTSNAVRIPAFAGTTGSEFLEVSYRWLNN
jgi:hypothetical protein